MTKPRSVAVVLLCAATGLTSLSAGIALSIILTTNNWVKNISLGIAGGIPFALVTYHWTESKYSSKLTAAERLLGQKLEAQKNQLNNHWNLQLDQEKAAHRATEVRLSKAKAELEQRLAEELNQRLAEAQRSHEQQVYVVRGKLTEIHAKYKQLWAVHERDVETIKAYKSNTSKLNSLIQGLEAQKQDLVDEANVLRLENQDLSEVNEEWKAKFVTSIDEITDERAEAKARKYIQQELIGSFEQHDSYTRFAVEQLKACDRILRAAQEQMAKMSELQTQNGLEFFQRLTSTDSWVAQLEAQHQEEKNVLKARILKLEQEKAGIITEFESPYFLEFGKGGRSNPGEDAAVRLGKAICKKLQIGLRLEAVESRPNGRGVVKAGYAYSKGLEPAQVLILVKNINSLGRSIQLQLGFYTFYEVVKNPYADGIICSWRFEQDQNELISKIPNLLDMGVERGFYITGHPGAGKSSVAIFLGQRLSDLTAMKLALNPHLDDKSTYAKYGFYEINEMGQIIEQIYLLMSELELRRTDKTRREPLSVILDEWGAIKNAAEKPKEVLEIIKRLSVEGRKFNINPIVIDHSDTVAASGMDTQFREAFYQLHLVGNARNAINNTSKPTYLKEWEQNWIRHSEGYPALLQYNGKYKVIKHPTHHEYEVYKDKGNPPKNLEKMRQIPLTIKVAGRSLQEDESSQNVKEPEIALSPEEQKLLLMAKKTGSYSARKATKCKHFKGTGATKSSILLILEKLENKGLIQLVPDSSEGEYTLKNP